MFTRSYVHTLILWFDCKSVGSMEFHQTDTASYEVEDMEVEEPALKTDASASEVEDMEVEDGQPALKSDASASEVEDMEVEDGQPALETDASASGLTNCPPMTDNFHIGDENTSSASPATSSLTEQWTSSAPTRRLLDSSQFHAIKQGFCCVVCLTFIKEPVFAPCCRSIIGCKTCIEQWQATSEHCPRCGGNTAGHDIFEVAGLSEAWPALSALFEDD